MGKVRDFINSFAGGVLSPRFDGRIDLEFYRKGARTLTNWIPWPLGAVQNRSGSQYIANTKSNGQGRLLPVILGQDEEYAVEVGNEYMRFYENRAQIIDTVDFVTVGFFKDSGAYTLTSTNGIDWVHRKGALANLNDVTYGNGKYVAVGSASGGAYAYLATSVDAIKWELQVNPKNYNLWSVAYGNSKYVAVGGADGADAYIITSSDGETWTERTNPKNFTLRGVIWASGLSLFVAVGLADGADAYIITSSDGITWAEQANPKNVDLFDVVYGNSLLVAVGNPDGADTYIITSSDGTTWTERTAPASVAATGITYGNSKYVAVGLAAGGDAYIITSSDGTTWTERSNPKNITLNDVAWSEDNSLFCAVGDADGTNAYVLTSPDGTTWTERTNPIEAYGLEGVVSRGITNVAEIASPYTTSELYDIAYEQKDNITYLVHDDHAPQVLTRVDTSGNEWSISVGGVFEIDTFSMFQEPLADFIKTPSASITINDWDTEINNFAEITASATIFKSGDIGKKIKAGAGEATILYIIEGNAAPVTAKSTKVVVDIDSDFDAVSYASGDWELIGGGRFQLTPSATGVERGYINLTNAAAVNIAIYMVFAGRAWTVSGSGTNEYYIANADAFFPEPGANEVFEKGIPMYKNSAGIGTLAAGQWGWGNNDALGYNTIYVRLTDEVDPDTYLIARSHWLMFIYTGATPITTAAGSTVLSSEVNGFVQINGGLVEITANQTTRIYTGRVIEPLDSTDASDTWTLSGKAFSATNGYPCAIAFHEDRLYFAGTDRYPLTIWGSAVGDYDNFIPGTAAADSVSFTLNAKEANKITWLVSRDILIAGTEGGEWQIGQRGAITTPSSIFARRQTQYGSDIRYPVVAFSNILFVERGNRKLRELTYAFENDSYLAPDKLLLAENLAVDLIKQLAYQPRNNSIVWGMLESGEVIGMAYEPDFNTYAWFKLNTGMTLAGVFDGTDDIESICVIADSTGVKELWAVVERVVNAGTIRTVEVFKNLFDSDTASTARMLDCHIVDTDLSTTVDGLTHLEGDTVTYIIDGDSTKIGTATVSSGSITVSSTPTVNVVAGIPYTSTLQTMRLEGGGQRGSSQGKLKRVWEVLIRLYRSMGGKVGTTGTVSKLESIRDVATLTSADRNAKVKQGYDTDGIVTVVQDQPLPITITMMQPEIQENEI